MHKHGPARPVAGWVLVLDFCSIGNILIGSSLGAPSLLGRRLAVVGRCRRGSHRRGFARSYALALVPIPILPRVAGAIAGRGQWKVALIPLAGIVRALIGLDIAPVAIPNIPIAVRAAG